MRDARIIVCGLAGIVVGCDRKPLRDAEGSIALDAGVSVVVDGAADVTASQDSSSLPGFVMIDDMENHADSSLPGSAFYWHSTTSVGLGNWFVSSSDDVVLDSLPGGGGAYFDSDFTQLPTWEIRVSEQWEPFMLRFADVPGPPPGVVSIDFVVSGTAGPFDLWIDDLALVCRGACP